VPALAYHADDGPAYERFLGRWSALAEILIDFAKLPADGPLLDVGCGTGSVALAMSRRYTPSGYTFTVSAIGLVTVRTSITLPHGSA
jgi:hypothetical protein